MHFRFACVGFAFTCTLGCAYPALQLVESSGGTPTASAATGALSSFGGTRSTGGSQSVGGNKGSGGTGGIKAAGGISSSGGTQSAGGASSNGGSVTTAGASAAGGNSAAGGVSGSGGAIATGGIGTGGTATSAGTTAAGGVVGTGGLSATGCTGAFEAMQGTLCVAKQVTVVVGTTTIGIDATEVTRGQYTSWLKTNPALPNGADANCGWKSGTSYDAEYGMHEQFDSRVCQTGCDHHPQVCVDWCDATLYCAAVGKRLCGNIQGGPNAYNSYADASNSEWFNACTSGGNNSFPYAGYYEPKSCNGQDYFGAAAITTVEVASLAACQSSAAGYSGVYDLSGNVGEWEDSCDGAGASRENDSCRFRGGSFYSYNDLTMQCDVADSFFRYGPVYYVGLRCCGK